MKLTKDLVVFDLETTGTWIEKDKIVEIAMVKCRVSGEKELYHKRVNPKMPIPRAVSQLIRITDEDVKDAPAFKDIAQEVLDFIGDSDFSGFNVERFDLPLLERECREAGFAFAWRERNIYDAQKVYHLNEKRDLSAAYKFYCGKDLVNAHSALADTEAVVDILQAQIKKYGGGEEHVDVLNQFDYTDFNDYYDSDRKFRWWNGQLYMMFGKYARRLSLKDVTQKDPGYLEWILSADFSEEVKDLVTNALKGYFPKQEEKNREE